MTSPTNFGRHIERREAIRRVSAMLGGVALIGSGALWSGCAGDRAASSADGATLFSPEDIAFLDEVSDTILPDTEKSPGAKAAQVGTFMAVMVTDCYEPSNQQIFRDGMKQLDEACVKTHKTSFMSATPAQRTQLLETLDRDAKSYMDGKTAEQPPHYFRMMKELSLVGYFTSEIGYTKALRYKESPGPFQPCVPYTAGEPIWARHA